MFARLAEGTYDVYTIKPDGSSLKRLTNGCPQPYGEIFVMRYDGTGVEQLTDNQWEDGAPGWQRTPPRQIASGPLTTH